MDRDAVQEWLDRYVRAWETYDPALIADLFSEEAVYRYHPWDERDDIVRGRDAILRSWLEPDGSASERDEPGTYAARYEPYAVDGRRAVAVGASTYYADTSRAAVARLYHNVFLLEFDDEARCSSFTELYMKRPDASG